VKPFWRRRLLVPVLALVALNAGTYFAYTVPRATRERTISARAVDLREQLATKRSRVEGLRQRARTIERNAADVTLFHETLGGKESLLRIQEDIAGIARQLGITIGSRGYSDEGVRGSASLARFEITMPIAGSYRQLVSFLQRIEALPHFVTVDSIAIRGDRGASGGSTNLNVVLSLSFVDTEPRRAR
jgi:Tfp pilus assembly protein PilO